MKPEAEECQWLYEDYFAGEDEEYDHAPLFNASDKCKTDPEHCENPGPAVFNVETGVLLIPVVKIKMPEEGLEERYEAKLQSHDNVSFMLEEATYLEGSEKMMPLPENCDSDPASCGLTAEEVKAIRACEDKGYDSEACEKAMMEAHKLPAKCDTDPASCDMTAEEVKAVRACEDKNYESEACEKIMMEAYKLPAKCDTDPASCDMTAEEVKAVRACEANPSDEACMMMHMAPEEDPDFMITESDKCKTDPASCKHPGPAILDEKDGVLHLPVVKLLHPDGTEEHYEVILRMDENSMMFFLEKAIFLDGDSKA